jgi:DNA repair protein Rad10
MDSIAVADRQKPNSLLRFIRRVKVDVGAKLAELEYFDFVVNTQLRIPVLFLSMKFHAAYREYISHRIQHIASIPSSSLGGQTPILLLLVDVTDVGAIETHLEEISLPCLLHGVRLLLAWDNEEAARLMEILHVFGPDRASDIARGNISTSSSGGVGSSAEHVQAQARESLTTLQGGVGQKDSAQLMSHFGNMRSIILSSKEKLQEVASIGSKKSNHIDSVFSAKWN